MSISQVIQDLNIWLGWSGLGLGLITLIAFFAGWGIKYRLTGTTIFTLLLSGSCWAFTKSYTAPLIVDGYKYAPVVYDNGFNLVVAQAEDDFPEESIQPTLEQIAGNLKGGGRNGAIVNVRLRKLVSTGDGTSTPIILGEVLRDINNNTTTTITHNEIETKMALTEEEFNDRSLEIKDESDISLSIEEEMTTTSLENNDKY